MGFFSSLLYYRPTPPTVTAAALADFVDRFAKLACTEQRSWLKPKAELKFGRAVDQDSLSTSYETEETVVFPVPWWCRLWHLLTGTPTDSARTYGVIKDIDWDFCEEYEALPELAAALRRLDQQMPVYRAVLSLGVAEESVVRAVKRKESPENDVNLVLCDCYLQVMPIEASLLPGEDVFSVGWMAFSLSGPGYLFPWKVADLVAHADLCPKLQAVAGICRELWPVQSGAPDQPMIEARGRMGELWPFPVDAPVDWAWGVNETG